MANTVTLRARVALGIGFLASFFTTQGIHILAVPYYQMVLGVDPFLLSVLMTAPMLLGTAAGPYIGYLSDNCRHRWGRRRPFIFLSCWLVALAYGLIWMVPTQWSQNSQVIYFAVFTSLFYITTACYTVPLNSLSYEMTNSAEQRTRILGFTAYFVKFGSLVYQWVFPLAQLPVFGHVFFGIKVVGWVMALVIFALGGALPALFIREVNYKPCQSQTRFASSFRAALKNPNMQRLLCIILLQMGGGACVAMIDYNLLVYYVSGGDLAEGAFWKAALSTSYALMSILLVPVVTKLSFVFGKLGALKILFLLNVIGGLLKWAIFQPDAGWLIVFDALLCSGIWVAMVVLIPSILADISQGKHSEQGMANTGMFASLYGCTASLSAALALVVYGLSLNIIGFDVALGGMQSAATIFSMRMILSGGTVLFSLLALLLLTLWKSDNT